MKQIYKYNFKLSDEGGFRIKIHESHKILTAQEQNGVICIWAEVDTDTPIINKPLYVIGTGTGFISEATRYVATVQQDKFIWHIYE